MRKSVLAHLAVFSKNSQFDRADFIHDMKKSNDRLTNRYRVLESLKAKLRDWAVRPVRPGCYSWAALSLIDKKTLYSACAQYGPQEMERI